MKGRGGEGSLASASEPSVLRRIGDGERDSIVLLDDEFFTSATRAAGNGDDEFCTSVTRPAGNGIDMFFSSTARPGGNSLSGSVTSISPSAGKRESGSLSSGGCPPSSWCFGTLVMGIVSTTMCGAEGSLSSKGRERFFTSTTRPAANGVGGEGS